MCFSIWECRDIRTAFVGWMDGKKSRVALLCDVDEMRGVCSYLGPEFWRLTSDGRCGFLRWCLDVW